MALDLDVELDGLKAECHGLDDDIARCRREIAATFDALIADAEQALAKLRHAYALRAELTDEQAARILRGVHEKAQRTVGFQAPVRPGGDEDVARPAGPTSAAGGRVPPSAKAPPAADPPGRQILDQIDRLREDHQEGDR